MKNLIAAACLAAGAAATPAWAQDSSTAVTGPRAELRIGADFSTIEVMLDDGEAPLSFENEETGITFAGEVGYDLAVGAKAVLGLYGGVEFSSLERCLTTSEGDEACLEAYRTITAGGRAGFRAGAATLLYVKGGYSRTRLSATYENRPGGIDRIEEEDDVEGFHLGAGAELALSRQLYGRLDYTYTDYEDGRAEFDGGQIDADMTRHQILVGIGIRF